MIKSPKIEATLQEVTDRFIAANRALALAQPNAPNCAFEFASRAHLISAFAHWLRDVVQDEERDRQNSNREDTECRKTTK